VNPHPGHPLFIDGISAQKTPAPPAVLPGIPPGPHGCYLPPPPQGVPGVPGPGQDGELKMLEAASGKHTKSY